MVSKKVYLSLGSNLGERQANLKRALDALEQDQIRITARSSIYETEPQDVLAQPWFLNLVVECETRCFPLQLLGKLQRIERELGRVRDGAIPKGPRVIDLDILLFGSISMKTPRLVIPHARMLERRFVLEPLIEVAPEIKHPVTKEPLCRLLGKVTGQRLRKMTGVTM